MTDKGASVIICCFNSAARLPETLQHLNRQRVPDDFQWEIVLVNNASKDDTVAVAQAIWSAQTPHNAVCRIVDEMQPGQMFARKRGAKEALYECLVFCDDDNWLGPDYVYVAWETLQRDARIGAAGGQNAPVSDVAAYPDWFDAYKAYYATGVPAPSSGDITERGYIVGAGLVTRKSLFLEALSDRYPTVLNGRNGHSLSTGDDFEYIKRLQLWGYTLYYDERMQLQHFIPRERLTLAYRDRLLEGIREATAILANYEHALYILKQVAHKNKRKLVLLGPLRMFLARAKLVRRDYETERMRYFYLAPFNVKGTPIQQSIKKFLHRN
ncbi:hypothetical protein DCC81_08215 [Chitinophaga parva]|uniref:Glycosyltransferase 2-like domain-containing protein n=1 Tax=Chitinophaga parva TaxID=2169414 RepID=A0A2T7BP54_9BACT|nr:glycosyltransferase [Chitinophaga parva]PUZ29420.1 hypothetical protein DCC81_08215 [Chitinophaga parva]